MEKLVISALIISVSCSRILAESECVPKDFGNGGTVCVCNLDHCDTIDPLKPLNEGQYIIYSSNKDGLRFNKSVGSFSSNQEKAKEFVLNIDSSIQYQTINGFGGAFTDAFGINVKLLDEKLQDMLLKSYFSDEGIEYSLCRVPLGGTDFSTHPYTYDDVKGDVKLEKFNLTYEDHTYKIPLMKEAISLSKGQLKFFASPWTSPSWTKSNNAPAGIGFLLSKYYQFWADYYIKFLEHYEQENITFWGITTGNEPINGIVPFIKIVSLGWTPNTQTKWISENLGPTIRNSKFKDIKIMVNDDQRFFLPWFPKMLFQNKATKNYTDGIAVHWYWDQIVPVGLVQATHDMFPDKFLLATEACMGDKFWQQSVKPGSWSRGETYAEDIIDDINHWVTGWVDWNMALNEKGGPTYINNFVDSPIIVNATGQEFYKNPMFYALGHFSKFVPPQSKRIFSKVSTSKLKVTALKRPDNGVAVVILNGNSYDTTVTIQDVKRGSVVTTATKHSINTFIYW